MESLSRLRERRKAKITASCDYGRLLDLFSMLLIPSRIHPRHLKIETKNSRSRRTSKVVKEVEV